MAYCVESLPQPFSIWKIDYLSWNNVFFWMNYIMFQVGLQHGETLYQYHQVREIHEPNGSGKGSFINDVTQY